MSQMVTELETARGHADILLCSVRWLQGHRLLEGILVRFSALSDGHKAIDYERMCWYLHVPWCL